MTTYYTPIEVANILKLNLNTVWRYIKEGKLPAFKVGRCYRISEEQLQEFMNHGLIRKGENTPINVGRKKRSEATNCLA